jgi:hypothetical protein
MPTLKLSAHGQVFSFPIPVEFDLSLLKDYCQVENIKKEDNSIYAKLNYLSRPFS